MSGIPEPEDNEPGFDHAPELLAAIERALEIVNADLRASGLPGPARLVVNEYGSARVASWDGTGGGGFGVFAADGRDPVRALVAVADDTQDAVLETLFSVWPVCPEHGLGVHAERRDDAAVWWCKGDSGHALALIGQLGRRSKR